MAHPRCGVVHQFDNVRVPAPIDHEAHAYSLDVQFLPYFSQQMNWKLVDAVRQIRVFGRIDMELAESEVTFRIGEGLVPSCFHAFDLNPFPVVTHTRVI